MKKRELMEIVIDQLYFHHSSFKLMNCEECHKHSAFPSGAVYSIPEVGALQYNLLGRTTKDVKDLPDLRQKFKAINVNAMDSELKMKLCCWPGDYVQIAMMLLYHTFHHADVHVFFCNYCKCREGETQTRRFSGTQLIYYYSLVYSLA